ncbi:MAG TPA: hypothetical protein VGA37_01160 [Gemmatimonadales bacterium]
MLPAIVLGAGGIAVLWWLRTRGVHAATVPSQGHGGAVSPPVTPGNLARLQGELRDLE